MASSPLCKVSEKKKKSAASAAAPVEEEHHTEPEKEASNDGDEGANLLVVAQRKHVCSRRLRSGPDSRKGLSCRVPSTPSFSPGK